MGLLDNMMSGLNSDEGLLGLALMAAAAPKPRRTGIGEGLLQATQFVQQNKDARAERELKMRMAGLQEQQLMQALAAQKAQQEEVARQRALEQQFRDLIPSPQMQAASDALRAGGGPTVENAARVQPVDPMAQLTHQAMKLGQIKPTDYLASLRKDEAPMIVPEGSTVLRGGKPVFSNPKANKPATAIEEFLYAQQNPAFMSHMREMANLKAPRTSVEVNTGQKGFDNTLKLRGDFRSEPIYKAHQEMQSAYAQIQQSLKQASPAGDLAGATKIMKLLDPGSVVRESELGMAMAASGLLDRLQNYAQNIMRGTKLTPNQRADFQRLADALYGESVKQFNSKRAEYQGIAERNQLNVMDVLGPASAAPSSRIVNFGDLK